MGRLFGSRHELEIHDLKREIERLKEHFETRIRTHELLLEAALAESGARAREALESRIQLAVAEAMAFAQQGLEHQEGALHALARRVVELGDAATPLSESPSYPRPGALAYAIGSASTETAGCRRIALRESSEQAFAADLANLPILPGGAARLVAAHVAEFVAPTALAEKVLPHWRSRLAPGGELIVVTLDGPAWSADLADCAGDFAAMRRRLGEEGPRRSPRWLLDADGLRETLRAAGFSPEEPTMEPPYDLRITARVAAS